MRNWMEWLPGGVLTFGCVMTLAVDHQHPTPLGLPLDSIPMVLAGQPLLPGTISQEQQDAAGMSSYIYRYHEGEPTLFDVYVGYYEQQTQGRTIHSPKNCLPGSGWEALKQTTTSVMTADGPRTVNRYLLQNKQDRAMVFYWYQGRGRVAANEYQVKWELLRDAALRGRSEEALVRVVVHLNETTDEAAAATIAEQVAAELIPAVDRVLPTW